MAFCHECGYELASGTRFCGGCGTAVPAAGAPVAEQFEPPPPTGAPLVPGRADTPPPTEPPPPTGPPLTPGGPSPIGQPSPASEPGQVEGAGVPTRRTSMWIGGAVAVAVLAVGAVLLTRGGDDDAISTATAPTATRPAVTEAPATDPPRTTPTTPPTTVAETTNPPTTPAPAGPVVDAGWRLATMIPEAVIPPFDSPWTGSPSPEITGSSLADGIYYIDYVSGDASSVVFDVGRFESCTVLGDEIACGPPPYDASAVGQVRPPATQVTVPLDDSTRVVVEGWDCAPIVAEGNGADLAAMYEALGADLDVTFEAALSIGGDEYDMMQAVRNDPASPFGPQSAACDDGYSLVWRFGDAPPVLLQQVADFDTGGAKDAGDVLIPTVIEIAGDETTLYFYAGFFS